MQNENISREEIEKFQSEESRKRLQALVTVANVKKAYDYMFSGLNTEVLDYKIQYNFSWFLSLPLFRGQSRDPVATGGSRLGKEYIQQQQLYRDA